MRRAGALFITVFAYFLLGPSPASERDVDTSKAELPFKVPAGFVVEKVAGPPLVEHPMFACFDDRGRLHVTDSLGINVVDYENLRNANTLVRDYLKNPRHLIRLLEDTKGSGRFDKSSIFADEMTYPEGILWHEGAVITASPPSLWRLQDSKGTGKADQREELLTGFYFGGHGADMHGPSLGPDGRIYFAHSSLEKHEVRRPGGPVLLQGQGPRIFRCRPDGSDLEAICGAMANPVEVAFTTEGEPLACGAYFGGPLRDGMVHCVEGGEFPIGIGSQQPKYRTGDLLPPAYREWSSPAGIMRYRSAIFGPEYRDSFFVAAFNLHSVQRFLAERDGATYRLQKHDFLVATDPEFHPTDVVEDADGSLLVIDTGHWFGVCNRTSKRGVPQVKGGIYRIRKKDAPVVVDPWGLQIKWEELAVAPLARLLDDPRWPVRDRAIQQLARPGGASIPTLRQVVASGKTVQARRNAVWALHRIATPAARAAIRLASADKDASVRLTAVRCAGLANDADAFKLMQELLKTDSPPIRLEAATALGRIGKGGAAGVLLDSLRLGGDRYLEHAVIYALIRLDDRDAIVPGLRDPSPQVRRGALIALDQMDHGNLRHEMVTPLLDTNDPALQASALAVITRRGWSKEIIGLLSTWLAQKEAPAEHQESLRGAVLGLCKDASIHKLVADTLANESLPVATRLLLVETISRAPLEPLPDSWIAALGQELQRKDERLVRQAVGAVRAGRVGRFDEVLVRLARDTGLPADLRVEALAAAAPRLPHLAAELFDLLIASLDGDRPPLDRLAAADALGKVRLADLQLEKLASVVARVGALEMPHLAAAFERSKSPAVGRKLVAGLGQSSGLESLTLESLQRILRNYPAEIAEAARPLFRRLEVDTEKQKAHLASLQRVLKGGDAKRGHEVFFGKKASCAACHTVDRQGGQVGPDLTKIGTVRNGSDLLEAIVFPSAGFSRGFEPYVMVTKTGKQYSGILRHQTSDAVHFATAERAEIRVARREIDSLEPGKVSVMPQGLDAQLSRQELSDLIAFLLSLH